MITLRRGKVQVKVGVAYAGRQPTIPAGEWQRALATLGGEPEAVLGLSPGSTFAVVDTGRVAATGRVLAETWEVE